MTAVGRRSAWLLCGAGSVLAGAGATTIGLPGGWLLAGALAAGAVAVGTRAEIVPHRSLLRAAQGFVAVLAAAPLGAVGAAELARFGLLGGLSIVLTLALSIGCGCLLTRWYRDLTPTTGIISLIAGGASTISTIAGELGADQRVVSFVQYLRLVAVTLTLPLLADVLGGGSPSAGPAGGGQPAWAAWAGVAVTAGIVLVGGPLGRSVRLPAAALLGPLVLAAALQVWAPGGLVPVVPGAAKDAAFVVVGWQAGGTFSAAALARFARYLPGILLFVAVTVAGCFGMAVVMSATAGIPLLDAYLATSPGGIYSVLAIAHDTCAGSIVATLQVLRMVVMLLAAVLLSRLLRRRRSPAHATAAPP